MNVSTQEKKIILVNVYKKKMRFENINVSLQHLEKRFIFARCNAIDDMYMLEQNQLCEQQCNELRINDTLTHTHTHTHIHTHIHTYKHTHIGIYANVTKFSH